MKGKVFFAQIDVQYDERITNRQIKRQTNRDVLRDSKTDKGLNRMNSSARDNYLRVISKCRRTRKEPRQRALYSDAKALFHYSPE